MPSVFWSFIPVENLHTEFAIPGCQFIPVLGGRKRSSQDVNSSQCLEAGRDRPRMSIHPSAWGQEEIIPGCQFIPVLGGRKRSSQDVNSSQCLGAGRDHPRMSIHPSAWGQEEIIPGCQFIPVLGGRKRSSQAISFQSLVNCRIK